MNTAKPLPMLPSQEKLGYHDEESRSSLEEEGDSFLNHSHDHQSTWQQIKAYGEHIAGPNTRGAMICKIMLIVIVVSSLISLIFTIMQGQVSRYWSKAVCESN
jgi:hypothetical protein